MTVTLALPTLAVGPLPASATHASPPPGDVPRRAPLAVAAPELQPDDRGPPTPPIPRPPARPNRKRRALAVLAALALAALAAASLWSRRPPPLPVQACSARKGPITRVVSAAGKLEAAAQVKLSASVSGELVELGVREGDAARSPCSWGAPGS